VYEAPIQNDGRSSLEMSHRSSNPPPNDEEKDEFGRVRSVQPKKIRWPPCFDTNGSAFVLDTRSGMFYEAISDFFYDPKSKLYYGNKQGAYFQYDAMKQQFINVSSDQNAAVVDSTGSDAITEPALPNVMDPAITLQPSSEPKKASITINLKTKALASDSRKVHKKAKRDDMPGKEKSAVTLVSEPVVVVPKQHAANIEKWSERQSEMRNEEKGKDDENPSTKAVTTTSKGEPICLVCRRRFPNLEKLRYHEGASNLHKENLAKQQALQVANAETSGSNVEIKQNKPVSDTITPSTVSTYVDRAEQRRKLHQPAEEPHRAVRLMNADIHSIVSVKTQRSNNSCRVQQFEMKSNLDESNIGHQMLQKLGWKAGNALGRNQPSTENSTDLVVEQNESIPTISKPAPSSSLIEQDWDRIEAISKRSSQGIALRKKGIGH
jgi:RNA-binding protein 5/10